jgi:hypothetical protein
VPHRGARLDGGFDSVENTVAQAGQDQALEREERRVPGDPPGSFDPRCSRAVSPESGAGFRSEC